MTTAIAQLLLGEEETRPQRFVRWIGAALCIAVLHAGSVLAVMYRPEPPLPSGEPPAAVLIELAPMPMAPDTPPQEVAVGPEAVMSQETAPSEEKQEQPDKSEPEPVLEHEAEVQPDPQPPTPIETPKLAEMPDAEAVLPPPAEPPPPEQLAEPKPPEPPKPKEREKESSRPQEQAKQAATATTAPRPMPAPKAKTNAAPSSGTASATSIASWRGTVVAHLNRHKRYPGGGTRGTSSVAFTIDRSGHVLSARLIGSSGSSVLDQEAVSLARRASPVPAPPPNISGRSIVLSVPIRFSK